MPGAGIVKLKIQLYCGEEIAMGPGKADLLDAIRRCGSISGAGRDLGMSYRRAWLLVDAMNRCWREPLVATAPGDGARVTRLGGRVLAQYRALQAKIDAATDGPDFAALCGAILAEPRRSQKQ